MKTVSSQSSPRTDSPTSPRAGKSRRIEQPQGLQQQSDSSGRSARDGEQTGTDSRRGFEQQSRTEPSTERPSQQIHDAVAHEEVARRAYELWEQEGCPDGQSERHWLEAEKQLRGSSFGGGSPAGSDARDQARAIKASAERRANAPSRN